MALFRGPIIITGGAGFLGANLAAHLLAGDTDADILVVDDCRRGSWSGLLDACDRAHVPAYPGDFLADACADIEWRDFLEDIEPAAVFHLAGAPLGKDQSEKQYLFDEIEGFRSLLYGALDLGIPLVYASSSAVYGDTLRAADGRKLHESAAGRPTTIEGFARWTMENLHRQAIALRDPSDPPAHVVGLRIFDAFGPGENRDDAGASLPARIARALLAREPLQLTSAGADIVSIRDVLACLVCATARGAPSGVYNCASGDATPARDIAATLAEGFGLRKADVRLEFPARADAPRADIAAAKRALKWSPAHATDAALRDYAAHLASQPAPRADR